MQRWDKQHYAKRYKQALQRTGQLLVRAQAMAKIGVWEWDLDTDELYWSDGQGGESTLSFYGRLSDFLEIVHPKDRQQMLHTLQCARAGDLLTIEYRLLRPDGSVGTFVSQGELILDSAQKSRRMFGIARNISEERQVQQQLQDSEQRCRSLKDNNPEGICSLDLNGSFTGANPAFARMTGYSADELLQMTYKDLLCPECLPKVEFCAIQDLPKYPPHSKQELRLLHKDGATVDVSYTHVPITIGEQVVGTFVIVKDLTEQRKTEDLLRRSEKLSAVGQLAAGVAHEIRNPLTALKGFIHLLKQDYNPAYLDIMMEELNHIELVSSEMLMLAKPQTLQFERASVNHLLQSVATLLKTQAIMKNVEIVTRLESDSSLQCDPNQLKQVFVNLMKNAIEAMQSGGTLTVRSRDWQVWVLVEVIDQGIGISKECIASLGDPFYSTKTNGTGLGLLVTHRIVENHQGKLEFASEVGQGTTVRVLLPRSE
ncbi:MAG: hypothetical protein A2201_06480 [Alicyclobacillus sp. RIFOXYA1_FULL_53_8]|nr:MAG: hypothetical protein A2201_06480 [Alicyclobacillus sp. RIFOXYA1_FULL_53_8]